MLTKWGESIIKERPLQDYPRPQLFRNSYFNLNGIWQYAIRKTSSNFNHIYDGDIVVPFSPESTLSGVNRVLQKDETLFYRLVFNLPNDFLKERTFINFGAVDQIAKVYLNGQYIGEHEGGYLPFSLECSNLIKQENNLLELIVNDNADSNIYGRGKQMYERGGVWYTPISGIWQTVWVESTPSTFIRDIRITPDFDNSSVHVDIKLDGEDTPIFIELYEENKLISTSEGRSQDIKIVDFKSWSPDSPFLYDLIIRTKSDEIKSYFGMRKFSTTVKDGFKVFTLNNKPIFYFGLLDQGYWSDGIYTAPSDEALKFDIEFAKKCGFNMLRKHIKVEPLRWYYHCDKLGMVVWQDFLNGGDRYNELMLKVRIFLDISVKDNNYKFLKRDDPASRNMYVRESLELLSTLYNVPSIAEWTPFNEGWGQFDALNMCDTVRQIDNTRIIDHASGWYDMKGGDVNSHHLYFRPIWLKNDHKRVLALTEFGGYAFPIEGHCYTKTNFGYGSVKNADDFLTKYKNVMKQALKCRQKEGLSAFVYTQISDVEDENNGLISYDRKVIKVDEKVIALINDSFKF